MKTSFFKKIVASLLSMLLVFYSLEISNAIAAYASEEKEQIELLECVPEDAEMRYHHVKHLDQYDTEDTVAYLNDDGTTTFYIFKSNIRYKNENGDLVQYDNTLVEVKESKTYGKAYKYKTKSSDAEILFPEHFQNGNGVKIKRHNYSLEVIPVPLLENEKDEIVEEPTFTPEITPTPTATPEETEIADSTDAPTQEPIEVPTIEVTPTVVVTNTPEPTSTPVSTEPTITPVESEEPSETPTESASPELSVPNMYASVAANTLSHNEGVVLSEENNKSKDEEVWGNYTNKDDGDVERKYKVKLKDDDKQKKDRKAEYMSNESDDIVYSYSATDIGIKENIIINKYTGQNCFDFIIKAPNLKLSIFEGRIIEFIDVNTDEIIFISEDMYAIDSYNGDYIEGEGHFTDDVTVSIIASNKDEHRIRITVPEEYLSDSRTVYPVTVDPSYGLYNSTIIDTYVNSKYPDEDNYSNEGQMYVGYGTGTLIRKAYGLAKFDFTGFRSLNIDGNNITSAIYNTYNSYTYTSTFYLRPYELSTVFKSYEISWNMLWSGYSWTWNNREYLVNHSGWYGINITEMVRKWVRIEQETLSGVYGGFLLRERDDTYDRLRKFSTAQSSSNRPYLVIQYDADRQDPNPPSGLGVEFEPDPVNIGKSEATVVWNPAIDNPIEFYNSGIQGYRLYYKEGDGAYQIFDYNNDGVGNTSDIIVHNNTITQYSVNVPNLNPRTYYTFKVETWDAGTGTSSVFTNPLTVNSGDYNPPSAPDEIILDPQTWTTDISPIVAWNGVSSEEGETLGYEFAVDDPNGTWHALSAGSIYNNDLENLLQNSAFDSGTTGWSATSSTNAVNSKILTNTADGSEDKGVLYQNTTTSSVPGNKIYAFCNAKVINTDCDEISLNIDGVTTGTETQINTIENPEDDQWYNLSGIVDIPADFTGNYKVLLAHQYEDTSTASGNSLEVNGANGYKVFLIDLTAEYGAGNEPDLETCDAVYGSQSFCEIDLSTYISSDGQHSIYVRANDGFNTGENQSGVFYYDATLPIANFDSPADTSVVDSQVSIIGDVSDATSFARWELRYAEGDTETISNFTQNNILASDFTESPIAIENGLLYEWNMTAYELEDGPYSLWLRAYDKAGNYTDDFITINKSAVSQSTDPMLTFTVPDPTEELPEATIYPYTVTYTGDSTGTDAQLYANGELVDDDVSDGLKVDFRDPKYHEGENYSVYVKANDNGEIKYSAQFYETPFFDYFNDTSKLVLPLDNNIEHDIDKITLKADETTGDYSTDINGHTAISAFNNTISGYVTNAVIKAGCTLPTGTDIVFEVSNDGENYQLLDLSGVDFENEGISAEFNTPGEQIILKATLKTTDSSVTPELLWWTADIEQVAPGQEIKVKLIHEPVSVSVTPNVNYKTLIRWSEDELFPYPEGTTFNVYRLKADESTNPSPPISLEGVIGTEDDDDLENVTNPVLIESFGPEEGELIAEGLTDMYFYDYNLDYGELYSYKVSAVYDFDEGSGENFRESILSAYNLNSTGRMISEGEFDKRLGLQDYWKYTGFVTGSGTGQIELSKGNLCYQSTDFVFPGPMFAMVMRRTYNSQATSKTPLGYSHDFSFNTSLMMEYDSIGNEIGVILKDGDGTIHRFSKNIQGTYDSPNGVFMDLTHENIGQVDEMWKISRNDGVDYLFNKYMQLQRFEERNGNFLDYEYDDRGNFISITDNAGNIVEFRYNSTDLLSEIVVPAIENDEYRIYEYHYYTDDTDGSILPFLKMRDLRVDEILVDPQTGEKTITNISNENYIEKFSYLNYLVCDIYDGEGYSPTPGAGYSTTITYDGAVDGYGSHYGTGVVTNVEYQVDSANTENFELAYVTDATSDYTDVIFYGNSTKYRYSDRDNDHGTITQIINPEGEDIIYDYNSDYQVTDIYYDNIVEDGTTPQTLHYIFAYDSHNNIENITDAEGNITTYDYGTDPNYNKFDKPNSVTLRSADLSESITSYFTYYDQTGNKGNLNTSRDPMYNSGTGFGEIANTYYSETWENSTGRRGYPGQLKSTTDRYGNMTSYEYNSKGWLSKSTDAQGNSTLYEYDNMGNPIQITDAESRTHKIEYDILGRRTKVYYPNETTTPVEQWTYNKNHNVKTHSIGQGIDLTTTLYYYDEMNRLIQTDVDYGTSDITISTVSYDYISQGTYSTLVVKRIDSSLIESIERYNRAGMLVETSTEFGSTTPKNVISYEYDNIGNVTQITDQVGRVVKAEYDELNRITKTIVDPGDATHLNYTTVYEYDYLGNKTIVTDGEEVDTIYEYDDLNRLIAVTQNKGGGASDYNTYYHYDLVNDDDYLYAEVVDAAGGIKQTWYDSLGRVYKEINDGTNEDDTDIDITSTYYYDDLGRLEYKKFTDDSILGYTYNSKGQVVYEKYYEDYSDYGIDDYTDYSYYIYDTRGNVTDLSGEQDGNSFSYEWAYNILNQMDGQIERVTYDDGDGQTNDLAASQLEYVYRTNGQLLQIKYPSALDESAPNISTYYEYDVWGRVSAIKRGTDLDKDTVRTYVYDDTGMVESINTYLDFDGSGTDYMLTDYDYNAAGLVTDISYKLNGTTQKENYQYQYNDNGMITDEDISINYVSLITISKDHTYDDIGRLTTTESTENGITTTTSYTYDEVGNRLSEIEGSNSRVFHYDELYRLLDIEKNSSYTEFYYEYDPNNPGEQTHQHEYNSSETEIEEQIFTYLPNGMLQSVQIVDSDGSNPTINESYMYNSNGQRMIKDTDGVLTKYFYSGSTVLLTADQSNNKLTENIVDLAGAIISSKRFDVTTDWYSYNYDIRRSTTAILNGTGNLATNYIYDEFGNITNNPTSFLNETQFTGSISDLNTGLYYMNARYYNPNTGRFLSQDSYKGSMYEPWTQNLYSYVGNNPVNFVDPTGHKWKWWDDLLAWISSPGRNIYALFESYQRSAVDEIYGDAMEETVGYRLWNEEAAENIMEKTRIDDYDSIRQGASMGRFVANHDFVVDVSVAFSAPNKLIGKIVGDSSLGHTAAGVPYAKIGYSKVISLRKEDGEYTHIGSGGFLGVAPPVVPSVSLGLVDNYEIPSDYSESFWDFGAVGGVQIDHCFWEGGASATSFGITPAIGMYAGYDYYTEIKGRREKK